MRVDAKIQARQWILNAIQNHSCIPNKEAEREIRKFVARLQRDLTQLTRSRELFIAANSQNVERKAQAIRYLRETPKVKVKGRNRNLQRQEAEIRRLIQEQKKDEKDRTIRFEYAVSK